MEERLLVQGLGRVTCRQEKRLLAPGVGVVVAGRIQASPAAVAAANPGSGGFVPGGGGFDPEETGTFFIFENKRLGPGSPTSLRGELRAILQK